MTTQIRKVAQLLELCERGEEYIAGLTLASVCAVFEDVIPEYMVITHVDEGTKLSKDIKVLRMYEALLLKEYQAYVHLLVYQMSEHWPIALHCACRLLSKHPHFNLTDELLKAVTKHASIDPVAVSEALKCIIQAKNLPVRYKALRAVNKILRSMSYKQVPVELIAALENIDFTVLSAPKKDRKRSRVEAELDRDLEATGQTNESELATANRRDIGEVLGIYLLIFKRFMDSHLLSPVLKGLVRIAPVVNVEMVWALLRELLSVVEKGELPVLRILECAESCLAIMKICGDTVQLEDRVLTKAVFNCLPYTPVEAEKQEQVMSCLTTLVLEKRIVAKEVLGSFIKRLLLMAPHYEKPMMRTFVYFVKCLMCKFPKARDLLEDDEPEDSRLSTEPTDPYTSTPSSLSFKGELRLLKTITTDKEVQRLLLDIAKSRPEGASLSPVAYFHTQLSAHRKALN